jgi:predicted methyltransferase
LKIQENETMNKKTLSALLVSGIAITTVAITTMAVADHHQAGEASQPLVIGEASTGLSPTIEAVLASDHRSDENKARDVYRHPLETLNFFGLSADMTVVEVWPGGGWYMDVLAPVVAVDGSYIAAGFDRSSDSEYVKRATQGMIDKVEANQPLFGKVVITEMAVGKTDIAPEGSADMVLTFRNVHNWMGSGFSAGAFGAMYKALKPGGILGVVEHRASTDEPQNSKAVSGYVRQDAVIKMAEDAGFQLVDTSEINANASDTKDHPGGVWTLPPSLRQGQTDREKYLAIGESDRMTLKFVKPAVDGMAAVNE